MLLIISFLSVMLGIVSDLIRTNRLLIEDNLEHTKRMRFPEPGQRASTSEHLVHRELQVLDASR